MNTYIVVGAGILGASTAYHLAKRGARVTLIDRNDSGQATKAGAGIICPWLTNRSNKPWYRLVTEGAKFYPKLVEELEAVGETETGYSQVGAINIFSGEDRLHKKVELAKERQKSTPEMGEVTKLSVKETKELFPLLSDDYASVHISGGARVNGSEICYALIRSAKKYGASIVYGNASLMKEKDTITGVYVNNQKYFADRVIVTGGAWAKELVEPLGVKFNVTSQKAQIVHLQVPNTDTSKWPVVMPPYNQYMLTFKNGRVVVGTTYEDNVHFDDEVTAHGIHTILDKALRVAPGIANTTYLETKVGFRPYTPNSLPVLGSIPRFEGLIVANGLGASGLTSGPYIGDQLAKLALGEETHIDFKDYDVRNAIRLE
ncbi:NAD(P)/FAD-dependent oxidoreductase [Salirhabdus salicampi]|uniref:NAD(P)/FAD-dependent oxidoreductase n=1 Tax=Salirhabdus salicampi TaxID=476102 RepID=UPI0020C20EA4|nr:FAD-binding oxidoreductase [Salirhabdus salicampi]MCP8616249.1 FAD-binding oxidoreductase [Salirhabdus salicampi]